MGQVIRIDNSEGDRPALLTDTGKGGLLSTGYLRDEPAAAYLGDDEVPVFALANQKRGVELERGADTRRVASGSGYRTIAVVTDRRLLVLVGDSSASSVDGDQAITVPLVDVEGVETETGRRGASLTVTRSCGNRLVVHAGADGIDAVADYVTEASQAWIHVENRLDDVKRSLVAAASRRDERAFDDALVAATDATEALADPRERAERFADEWGGRALCERVEDVAGRVERLRTDVRLARARSLADEAEFNWRDSEYEAAHVAYEEALAEYRAVLRADDGAERADVPDEAERVRRMVEQLERAPLEKAVEADRAAAAADDPAVAADVWEGAIEHYRTTMELDWGAEERRFAGDPDRIRDRLQTVVGRLVEARREAATTAKRAGDWYVGAEQYEVAVEEFEDAREQYERALEVARDAYTGAVDHLEVERDALCERIERVEAARDGEPFDPVDAGGDPDEPAYDVEATIGATGEGDAVASTDQLSGDDADDADQEADEANQAGATTAETVEERLRELDEAAFVDVVRRVLSESGWTATVADADAPHDVTATKSEPAEETMVVRVAHRPSGDPVAAAVVDECAELRRDVPDADAVMVATSAGVTDAATRRARRHRVQVFDDECLSAVIESAGLTETVVPRRVEIGE